MPALRESAAGYAAAISLAPADWRAHAGRGGILRELGDVEGALAEYEAALRVRKDDPDLSALLDAVRAEARSRPPK